MLAVVSMALVSCGGGSTGVMTPQTTKISGDLGNEFEVVDKPAKLSKTGIFNVWTIELKSLTDDHSGDYFVERVPVGTITADGYTHEHVGFGLETYDKDGNLVAKRSAAEGGMGYCQSLLFHNGKRFKGCMKPERTNRYRALCEIGGKLCIVDCARSLPFGHFMDGLEKLGVKNALYCDMGRGWNYSWYRKDDGKVKELFTTPGQYTTNWIAFYD